MGNYEELMAAINAAKSKPEKQQEEENKKEVTIEKDPKEYLKNLLKNYGDEK